MGTKKIDCKTCHDEGSVEICNCSKLTQKKRRECAEGYCNGKTIVHQCVDCTEIRVCSECEEEVGVQACGEDDYLDYCDNCNLIEGSTHYVKLKDYEGEIS